MVLWWIKNHRKNDLGCCKIPDWNLKTNSKIYSLKPVYSQKSFVNFTTCYQNFQFSLPKALDDAIQG